MATVTRQIGAYCGKSVVVSVTYDDQTLRVLEFAAKTRGEAEALVTVRDAASKEQIASAELRADTLSASAPECTVSIGKDGRISLVGHELCIVGSAG